jgi:hypothetical protein
MQVQELEHTAALNFGMISSSSSLLRPFACIRPASSLLLHRPLNRGMPGCELATAGWRAL